MHAIVEQTGAVLCKAKENSSEHGIALNYDYDYDYHNLIWRHIPSPSFTCSSSLFLSPFLRFSDSYSYFFWIILYLLRDYPGVVFYPFIAYSFKKKLIFFAVGFYSIIHSFIHWICVHCCFSLSKFCIPLSLLSSAHIICTKVHSSIAAMGRPYFVHEKHGICLMPFLPMTIITGIAIETIHVSYLFSPLFSHSVSFHC